MTIIWKEIENYEGLYKVSNNGKIINKNSFISEGWVNNSYGHRKVRLFKNGKHKDFYLHRLVAKAFIVNINNKPCVNHIDSNPSNNNITNLEWCTQKENIEHAVKNNRMNRDGIKVLNLITNEVFNSIKDASDSIGMKQNTLVYKLLGKRKNNTSFVLYKENKITMQSNGK
jgi:hypothetical protein